MPTSLRCVDKATNRHWTPTAALTQVFSAVPSCCVDVSHSLSTSQDTTHGVAIGRENVRSTVRLTEVSFERAEQVSVALSRHYGLHVEQDAVRAQGRTATSSVVQTSQFLCMYGSTFTHRRTRPVHSVPRCERDRSQSHQRQLTQSFISLSTILLTPEET